MSTNLYTAANQYRFRPADERFETLAALANAGRQDRQTAITSTVPVADFRAIVTESGRLAVQGKSGTRAALTHWAFGQLSAAAGAPAGYMRQIPADLAVQCLNHGFLTTSREEHKLLMTNGGPTDCPYTIRALTSGKYSRVWDHTIADQLTRVQEQHPEWQLPMTWEGKRAGAYRGDRDQFVFLTNGGSIVEDKSIKGFDGRADGTMFRGIIVRNSEVGAAALQVETFLFRVVCGNHIIWHATEHQKTYRRHVGLKHHDAEIMISKALRIADDGARQDEQTIAKLASTPYGATTDAVIAKARKDGLSEKDARASYAAAERNEADPRSVWGFVNGITRHSQANDNQDDRNELEQLAGAILKRARLAVAA